MANITYTRSASFNDYIDGETIVSAGGADGFNVRFHALEKEFDTIGTVVGQLDAAIVALGSPPAQQAKMVFTPNLVSTAVNGWSHLQGLAQKPPGVIAVQGMQSISLPDKVVVQSLRVLGANSGAGSLRVILQRQALIAGASQIDQIARVDGAANPFDLNSPATATFATIDNGAFKYFLVALLDNAAAADTVTLSAFQIVYAQT